MKAIKAHAYTTPGSIAPLVTPDECARLFQLPALAYKLFVCLVHVVNFKTGHGQTGYPELIAMLTPAQPERGRPVEVPTRDQIKHMLRRFVDLGLIARDQAASEARGNIIFHMQPRSWQSVSDELAARVSARGASPANPDAIGAKRPRVRTSRPGSRPHLHEPETYNPLPPNVDNLSTGEGESARPRRGEKLTPPGGSNVAPAGPTPPPEARTDAGVWARVGEQLAPPGGPDNAPGGARPPWAELGDGWRYGPPKPVDARGVDMSDPANWQRDETGALIVPVGHPSRERIGKRGGLRKAALS